MRAEKQFCGLKIFTFFDADQDPRSGIFLTMDPGSKMEKLRSGIYDKHTGSATLSESDLSPSIGGRYRTGQHLPNEVLTQKKQNGISQ